MCWNCGGKGHVQSKCPSPKLNENKGNGKQGASGSANVAEDFDDTGAWSVKPVESALESIDRTKFSAGLSIAADTFLDMEDLFEPWSSYPDLNLLMSMPDSDSESVLGVDANRRDFLLDVWPQLLDLEASHGLNPFSEFIPTWDDECSDFSLRDSCSSTDSLPDLQDVSDNEDEGDFTYECPHTAYKQDANTADAITIVKMSAPTELYDSSCTQHLSPFEHEFSNHSTKGIFCCQ